MPCAPKLMASATQTQICRRRQRGTIVTELITPFDFDDCSLHTQALHSVRVMRNYLSLLQPFISGNIGISIKWHVQHKFKNRGTIM